MLLYKGVAPGTHNAGDAVAAKPFASSTVDPRRNGFHGDRNMPDNHNSVLRHIASYSWPSPYVSASMSFAVASDYAGSGGWVFEIDLASDPSIVINPLEVLTKNFTHIHEHNGHQDLAHGVIDPTTYAWILATPPLVGGTGSSAVPHFGPPSVTKPLTAILNAVRDSELLLRNVPNGLVLGNVYLVP